MMVARVGPMKRIAGARPAIAAPSQAEKLNGVHSRPSRPFAFKAKGASGRGRGKPPSWNPRAERRLPGRRSSCTKGMFGSPVTAPSRVKVMRTVNLIVVVRRPPAGAELDRDVMDAVERRLRFRDLSRRAQGQRHAPYRGKAPNPFTTRMARSLQFRREAPRERRLGVSFAVPCAKKSTERSSTRRSLQKTINPRKIDVAHANPRATLSSPQPHGIGMTGRNAGNSH